MYVRKHKRMNERTDGPVDERMDVQTDRGAGHISPVNISAVAYQCNAVEPSSIVQLSHAVGWFTRKYKEIMKDAKIMLKLLNFPEPREGDELHRQKSLSS